MKLTANCEIGLVWCGNFELDRQKSPREKKSFTFIKRSSYLEKSPAEMRGCVESERASEREEQFIEGRGLPDVSPSVHVTRST